MKTHSELVKSFRPARDRVGAYFKFERDGMLANRVHPAELGKELLVHHNLSDTQTAFILQQCRTVLSKFREGRLDMRVKHEIQKAESFYHLIPRKNPYTKTSMLGLYSSSIVSMKSAATLYNQLRRDGQADETVFMHMLNCTSNLDMPNLFRTLFEYMWSGFTVSVAAHMVVLKSAVRYGHTKAFWTALNSLFQIHKEPSFHNNRELLITLIVEMICLSEGAPAAHNLLQLLSRSGNTTRAYLGIIKEKTGQRRQIPGHPFLKGSFPPKDCKKQEIAISEAEMAALKVVKIPITEYAANLRAKTSALMAQGLVVGGDIEIATMYNSVEGMLKGYLVLGDVEMAKQLIKKFRNPRSSIIESILEACADSNCGELVIGDVKARGQRITTKMNVLTCDILAREGLMHAAEIFSMSSELRISSPISMHSSLLAGYAASRDTDGVKSSLLYLSNTVGSLHRGVLECVLRYISNEQPIEKDWDLNSEVSYNWPIHFNSYFEEAPSTDKAATCTPRHPPIQNTRKKP
eukprot:TRINITY_DN9224_c2_g1_i1.p1 TRINITY_DN9224_c2_g1~~TRINITY_DN9224_c2_g1_i1.p1  ORF type:complete len:520 (+),score=48.98 TRINITY_DN9224_c2_g1_i1:62-1621(+)